MIVHADPDYLPYSVLALQKLWNDVDIRVTSYKHSSITSSTQFTVPFQKSINSAAKTIIHLTLIWKQSKIKLIFLPILKKYTLFLQK